MSSYSKRREPRVADVGERRREGIGAAGLGVVLSEGSDGVE